MKVPETDGFDFRVLTSVVFLYGAGSLVAVTLFAPRYLRSDWLIGYGAVGLLCFAIGSLILATRRLSAPASAILVALGDVAVVVAACTQVDRSAARLDAALLVLPALFIAVFLPWRWLLVQTPAGAACAVVILVLADAPPFVVFVQTLVITISSVGPAAVVVILREQLARAVLQARAVATLDPLTGLLNRRGLDGQARALARRARRDRRPLGVLVIDLDHFKQVNDRFGHAAGDDVLKRMAEAATGCLRPDEVVARLGGEEFAVVTVLEPPALAELAERLRVAVEKAGVAWAVTASIGVSWGVVPEADDAEQALWSLIDRADDRMYEAKHAGRNQVCAPA